MTSVTDASHQVRDTTIDISPSSSLPTHASKCGTNSTELPPIVVLPTEPTVIAPDGSEVRVLATTSRASMANFRLARGKITIGVVHRTVDEVWYITGGRGLVWRCPAGKPDQASIDNLEPGVSVPIPVGTHFQFRAAEDSVLDIIGVDTPAWPGDGEAVPSDMAPWKPNV